jgi:hypothetical protein
MKEDTSQKDFLFKLQASIDFHLGGVFNWVDFTKYQAKLGLAMKINNFNPIVEAHFGSSKNVSECIFYLNKLSYLHICSIYINNCMCIVKNCFEV